MLLSIALGSNAVPLASAAGCDLTARDYSQTIEACNALITRHGLPSAERSRALETRAQANMSLARPAQAIADYSRAIAEAERDERKSHLLYRRGMIRIIHLENERQMGLVDIEQAYRYSPTDTRIGEILGEIYLTQERWEEAEKIASRVLGVEPNSEISHQIKARAREELRRKPLSEEERAAP